MKRAALTSVIAIFLSLLAPSYAAADNYSCDAPGVILGTPGNDFLQGTPGVDVICALSGDDEIHGLGGDDVLIGGKGEDTIIGDDGLDLIFGGPGADKLFGSAGDDKLFGGEGKDRLDGGAARDVLDGESGVNTCIKSAGSDIYKNCFYDSAGPTVVSVAIDPKYALIDATLGSSYVMLKIVLSDPGVGYSWGGLSFRNYGVSESNLSRASASMDPDVNPTCTYMGKTLEQRISAGWGVFCRESGDELFGTYLVGFSLPKGSKPGKWTLSSIELYDKVRNSRTLDVDQLKAKGLNVNFRQIGSDPNLDTAKPKITSVKLQTQKNISLTNSGFRYHVAFTDTGSGIKDVNFGFTNTNYKWAVESHLGISGSFVKGQPCIRDDSELSGIICLISGNQNSGVLEISGTFSRAIPDGTWSFDSISLGDKQNNSTMLSWDRLSKSAQAKLIVSKTWGFDVSDSEGPELANLSWSKTKIDTGSSDQSFEITLRVKDKTGLAAFDKTGVKFAIFPHFVWQTASSTTNNDAYLKYTADRISGSSTDGIYKLVFTVPAHTKQGTIALKSIELRDSAPRKNTGGMGLEQFLAKGWQTSITNAE